MNRGAFLDMTTVIWYQRHACFSWTTRLIRLLDDTFLGQHHRDLNSQNSFIVFLSSYPTRIFHYLSFFFMTSIWLLLHILYNLHLPFLYILSHIKHNSQAFGSYTGTYAFATANVFRPNSTAQCQQNSWLHIIFKKKPTVWSFDPLWFHITSRNRLNLAQRPQPRHSSASSTPSTGGHHFYVIRLGLLPWRTGEALKLKGPLS